MVGILGLVGKLGCGSGDKYTSSLVHGVVGSGSGIKNRHWRFLWEFGSGDKYLNSSVHGVVGFVKIYLGDFYGSLGVELNV